MYAGRRATRTKVERARTNVGETAYARRQNSALVSGQRPQQVLDLMVEMVGRGLQPNAYTYNLAIAACVEAHQHDRAHELLAELQVIVHTEWGN